MKESCIIVGAGTYGQVYAEYLKEKYTIIGFIDDNEELTNTNINGIRVVGNFEYLLNNLDRTTNVFIPIGDNRARVEHLTAVINAGFKTPCYFHPEIKIHESVKIGKCVYILAGTHIMPLTEIKDFVMISMGVNIAHHTIIDNGCFFAQGTNIGANINFKKNVFCGIASTIMTGVKTIGKDSLIGAGTVVIKDVPDNVTVVGNPGKTIKFNEVL